MSVDLPADLPADLPEGLRDPIAAPDAAIRERAAAHLASRATPAGALGRLGELGVWLSAAQGEVPPRPIKDVRCLLFAGDHGVSDHGVSAAPKQVTAAMMSLFIEGRSGMCVLAAAHGVTVRVLDISVDLDASALPAEVTAYKINRGSGAIHLEDAMTADDTARALRAGLAIAADESGAQGADLLISGDMGIGNTTPAAAMIAAVLGMPAAEVTGTGSGIDDATLRHKAELVQQALDRAGDRTEDPVELLTALASPDLAACVGFQIGAARAGIPVLLDGLMAVACAVVADRIAPGVAAWCVAGHRSTEPAQQFALAKLGLEPLLDLGMRLGEGSGAVAAVPIVRSAVTVMRDLAPLSDVMPG